MSFVEYEDRLIIRLRVLAVVFAGSLLAFQTLMGYLSIRYERLSTDLLYTGSVVWLHVVLMALSAVICFLRLGTLYWVTFYYGKRNSLTTLMISIGTLILSSGMEASPDRTPEIFFNYDWNTHVVEYAIRFVSSLAILFIVWFAASSMGWDYRNHRHRKTKMPLLWTYFLAAVGTLSVDLLFQIYFYLSAGGGGPSAPSMIDWVYPFIKAVFGFLFCCLIGFLLTAVRRKIRESDRAKKAAKKERSKAAS